MLEFYWMYSLRWFAGCLDSPAICGDASGQVMVVVISYKKPTRSIVFRPRPPKWITTVCHGSERLYVVVQVLMKVPTGWKYSNVGALQPDSGSKTSNLCKSFSCVGDPAISMGVHLRWFIFLSQSPPPVNTLLIMDGTLHVGLRIVIAKAVAYRSKTNKCSSKSWNNNTWVSVPNNIKHIEIASDVDLRSPGVSSAVATPQFRGTPRAYRWAPRTAGPRFWTKNLKDPLVTWYHNWSWLDADMMLMLDVIWCYLMIWYVLLPTWKTYLRLELTFKIRHGLSWQRNRRQCGLVVSRLIEAKPCVDRIFHLTHAHVNVTPMCILVHLYPLVALTNVMIS